MSLHLHVAERTDLLADGLAELLTEPLPDPFAEELVVVPAKGVERWLTQRLSHRLGAGERGGDGICAGVRFASPGSLVGLLLGREREDPWQADQLVWPLLRVIDDSLGEAWCATLARHLGHGQDDEEGLLRRQRRYSVARRLAGLFAGYAVQRPRLVTDWREGRDTDGLGEPLTDDLAWQAELWRRVVAEQERAGVPAPDVRHAEAVQRLRSSAEHADSLDLPPRLSLFGHTRLPGSEIELIAALAEQREVHLWLPQPSVLGWDGAPPEEDGHPLLRSLGRDSRELATSLSAVAPAPEEVRRVPTATTGTEEPPSLLDLLQDDLRNDRDPVTAAGDDARAARTMAAGAEGDRSVQVHACHGPARQVEVLREVLVGLLEDDPTLEPRDILVMCPDIETFAPLISAAFGLADVAEHAEAAPHPAHTLRVRLADRALSRTNPLLAVAAALVHLSGARVTATEVLDLAAHEAVRRRFSFDDEQLARFAHWVDSSGVRWGLDGGHRAAYEMQAFEHNTWRAGMDRILLGVAMSGDDYGHLGRGLPVDDVSDNEVDLVGRVAEFVDRLDVVLRRLATATTVTDWVEALTDAVHALAAVDRDASWQVAQFDRELGRALEATADAPVELRLADMRALLESRLRARPTRANFRTGTLTVCTMVPMRSVPHRVVCLLGLDDGVFPRIGSPDGDDVLARRPQPGERDVRSEDRQLFLDAILAATQTLVVTYTGANEHSGATRPPAVPLGELLDALDRTTAEPVRGHVLVEHPLQAHDARNLLPGALGTEQPFSFDRAAAEAARAWVGERHDPPPFLVKDLPARAEDGGDLGMDELRGFLEHPVRSFLYRRLDVGHSRRADEVKDAIPVDPDGLEKWQVGDRLLSALLSGDEAEAVFLGEQLRGTLPPGDLGTATLAGIVEDCQKLYAGTSRLRNGTGRTIDVDVDLGGGRRLVGSVPHVFGNKIVDLGYSSLKAKARLRAWVNLLALSLAHPDQNWTAYTVGRRKSGPQLSTIAPADERAAQLLGDLVALRDEGLTRPLPLPPQTAAAWAESMRSGDADRAVQRARNEWATDRYGAAFDKEDRDPAHRRVYGVDAPFEVLLDAGLPEYAERLWKPLLGNESRGAL